MTENDFNAMLSKNLRKLSPSVFFIKASDKFTIGISDFLIWHNHTCAALECKYVAAWPGQRSQLLKHPFKGGQTTFLESIALTGNRGFGLIGVGECTRMFLVPWNEIPAGGNWTTNEFIARPYRSFDFGSVGNLVEGLFYG